MSDKASIRDWLGFKGVDDTGPGSVERIRELESQLADLQSRRDITALTQEEFEILATETAMTMIKSAQLREAKAKSLSERILNESTRQAKATIEESEQKAKAIQSTAESRGQKYIQDAETRAAAILAAGKLQASQIIEAAQRDGERLINDATHDVGEYRRWLSAVITETERHHKIQLQSLATAENAIQQSRAQLQSAFGHLVELQQGVLAKLNPDDSLMRPTLVQVPEEDFEEVLEVPEVPLGAAISVLPTPQAAKRAVKRTADRSK